MAKYVTDKVCNEHRQDIENKFADFEERLADVEMAMRFLEFAYRALRWVIAVAGGAALVIGMERLLT